MPDEISIEDRLRKALDDAALALLERAVGNVKVEEATDGPPDPVNLAESVKAFETVGKYLADRIKTAPPAPKGPSKFDAVRSKARGETPSRRSRSAAHAPGVGGDEQ
jgi:hypothetical protein